MKKLIFTTLAILLMSIIGLAQNNTMYIMKNGVIVGEYNVEVDVDSIIFYNPEALTSNTFTDSRDGTVYKIIEIGNQTWMAENLKYLPEVMNPDVDSQTLPCYYVYDYHNGIASEAKQTKNYNTYGALYNWVAAQNSCPDGWHLATDSEWEELENYLADNGYNYDGTIGGGRDKIAKAVASGTGWVSQNSEGAPGSSSNPEYINKSGFSALPGGFRGYGVLGSMSSLEVWGYWWTGTTNENSSDQAYIRYMNCGQEYISKSDYRKEAGFSVRCIKDYNAQQPSTEYALTLSATPYNGGTISGGGNYEAGTSVTIVATPAINYEFVNWTGDVQYLSNATLETAVVTMPSENITLIANFVENSGGGDEKSFTDSRDGTVYQTVKIGNQTWMAENLKYLTNITSSNVSLDNASCAYVYGYNGVNVEDAKATSNYQTYGVLYNWLSAKDACPEGWYLPSKSDFETLVSYLGGENIAGGKLKETGTTHWNSPNNATNSSEFTALGGGMFYGLFAHQKELGILWSSEQSYKYDYPSAYSYMLTNESSDVVSSDEMSRDIGCSVRCIKGEQATQPIRHNLSLISLPASGGTVSGEGNYERGESVIIVAIPADGYRFVDWAGDVQYVTDYKSPTTTVNMPEVGFILYANFIEKTSPGEGGDATFTDSRDGSVYKTVNIGSQTWMAENLKYLPEVMEPNVESTTLSCYYVYDYVGTSVSVAKSTEEYKTYGVLYNWAAAKNSCPVGWHLPTDAEWEQLENYLANNGYNYDGTIGGGRSKIAKSIASSKGWVNQVTEGTPGNNDCPEYINKSGFSALPGGFRGYGPFGGTTGNLGAWAFWWTATGHENFPTEVYNRMMNCGQEDVSRNHYSKETGLSVRCVKD